MKSLEPMVSSLYLILANGHDQNPNTPDRMARLQLNASKRQDDRRFAHDICKGIFINDECGTLFTCTFCFKFHLSLFNDVIHNIAQLVLVLNSLVLSGNKLLP